MPGAPLSGCPGTRAVGVGGGAGGLASSEVAGCLRLGFRDHSFRCLSRIRMVSAAPGGVGRRTPENQFRVKLKET